MTDHPLAELLEDLAALYAKEGREGGDAAAEALRQAAGKVEASTPVQPNSYEAELRIGLSLSPEPIAARILTAMPYIRWGAADLRNGRIPDDLAENMPMCELVGPDGMIHHETVRVGLWLQTPNVIYGPRAHAAEETFLLLAGEAFWSVYEQPPARQGAGKTVHHPSYIQHTSITKDQSVFAAWRWSGDIGFDKYALKG